MANSCSSAEAAGGDFASDVVGIGSATSVPAAAEPVGRAAGSASGRSPGAYRVVYAVGGFAGRITVTRRPPIGERLASMRP